MLLSTCQLKDYPMLKLMNSHISDLIRSDLRILELDLCYRIGLTVSQLSGGAAFELRVERCHTVVSYQLLSFLLDGSPNFRAFYTPQRV